MYKFRQVVVVLFGVFQKHQRKWNSTVMPGFCMRVWTSWLFGSALRRRSVVFFSPLNGGQDVDSSGFSSRPISLLQGKKVSQHREVQNSVQHSSVFPVSWIPRKSSCENSCHFRSSTWAPTASDYFTLALLYYYCLNILQSETSSGFFHRLPVGNYFSVKILHASTSSHCDENMETEKKNSAGWEMDLKVSGSCFYMCVMISVWKLEHPHDDVMDIERNSYSSVWML